MTNKDSKKILMGIVLLFIAIIIFRLFFTYYIRANLFQAFRVPAAAMEPTIMKGDRVLADKTAYKNAEPNRGDLIVFLYPEDRTRIFLKRLIANGGETVEIRDGDVYVNDNLIKIPAIKNIYYYNRGEFGQKDNKITVPEESCFVLGDNSASSADSRYWGFVPKENIKGKVFFRYYPFDKMGSIK